MDYIGKKCPEGYEVEDMVAWGTRHHVWDYGFTDSYLGMNVERAFHTEQVTALKEYQRKLRAERDARRDEAFKRGNFMYFRLQALDAERKHWGDDDFWTEECVLGIARAIEAHRSGKPVLMYTEAYHESSMDFEDEYYSDGTKRTACYGYSD